jgi:cytochrome P450
MISGICAKIPIESERWSSNAAFGGNRTVNNPDFDAIDYFLSDSLVANPYPYFDYLRGECPVRREQHHGVVMVTGYEEAVATFFDPKTFSACVATSGPFPGFPVPLEGDDVTELIEAYRDQLPLSHELFNLDPPNHAAHRALVMRLFTPARMSEMEPFMLDLADRLIDSFIDRGECEFITEFAAVFTVLVIAELLGVPESDREILLEELLGPLRDRGLGSMSGAAQRNPFELLHERFTPYIEERRVEPRDDMMTRMATTPFPDGSMPTVLDVVRLASVLFVAGSGTSAQFLASGLQFIGEDPDLQQLLREEPERIPNFLEETLRMEGPDKGVFRLARLPKMVGGTEIPAGTTVMLATAGANRDPRKFECPNEFRADRENARQHLSFGQGIHLCSGAALARAEGRVGIRRFLERVHDIKISEAAHGPAGARTYEYWPSYILRGTLRLHLEFTSAGQ